MSEPKKKDALWVIRTGGMDGGPEVAAALAKLERELADAKRRLSDVTSELDARESEMHRLAEAHDDMLEQRDAASAHAGTMRPQIVAAQTVARAAESYARQHCPTLVGDLSAIQMHLDAALAKNPASGSLTETPLPSTAQPLAAGHKPEKQFDAGRSADEPASQPGAGPLYTCDFCGTKGNASVRSCCKKGRDRDDSTGRNQSAASVMDSEHRAAVFAAINGERDYQDRRWPGSRHSNVEFLVYIRSYVNEALEFASRNPDLEAAAVCTNNLRKVAALAVAAMEQNGVLPR